MALVKGAEKFILILGRDLRSFQFHAAVLVIGIDAFLRCRILAAPQFLFLIADQDDSGKDEIVIVDPVKYSGLIGIDIKIHKQSP